MYKPFPDPYQNTIDRHPKKWLIVSSLVTAISLVLLLTDNNNLLTDFLFGFFIAVLPQAFYKVYSAKLWGLFPKK
ncbi:MAG: hypothetical protein AB8G86_14375 [Saprospiraceae bacterium]